MRDDRRPLTPEGLVHARTVSSPQLSPDGTQIAFVVDTASRERGRSSSAIWLAATNGPGQRQLTWGRGEHSPRWSPEGGALLFVSGREAMGSQLFLLSLGGGEAQPLTSGPAEASAPHWSPDGNSVAFLRRDPPDLGRQLGERRGDDARLADTGYCYSRLCTLDVASGAVRHVSPPGAAHIWQFAWSPDGRELLAAVTPTPKAEQQAGTTDIVVYTLATGSARRLCQVEGYISSPCWSPDGRQAAFLAALEQPAHGEIVLVPSSGGEPRGLLGEAELTATWLAWPGPGDRLLFAAQVDLQSGLFAITPDENPQPIWRSDQLGRGVFGTDFSLDCSATLAATVRSGPETPPDVWVGPIERSSPVASGQPDSQLRQVTDLHSQGSWSKLGRTETVYWRAGDGLRLSGLLVLPTGYQPGRLVPLVIRPHGGPGMLWSDGFYASGPGWTHLLANQGIAVFMPNPRGGAGRGRAFLLANRGDLGGADFADIMSGIDALIVRGVADPRRLGIGGWSYGGYMTAWAITQTDRFKAAVVGAGIVNWISYEGQCDCPQLFPRWYAREDVYRQRQRSVASSPITHVARVRTPTLILQGADDPRVPAPQAGELYQALRQLGVPVEYVCYPREGHAITEREHQIDLLERASAWFKRYLLD